MCAFRSEREGQIIVFTSFYNRHYTSLRICFSRGSCIERILPIACCPDMNIKQQTRVCNLKPAIYHGICEGNGRGQGGGGEVTLIACTSGYGGHA